MDILKVVLLGIAVAVIGMVLKKQQPEFALLISLVTGLVIMVIILAKMGGIIVAIESLAKKSGLQNEQTSLIIKTIGIAYIGEFGSRICADAGESALASKIQAMGKVIVLAMAVPLLAGIMELIVSMVG